jgi:hypothetical protein
MISSICIITPRLLIEVPTERERNKSNPYRYSCGFYLRLFPVLCSLDRSLPTCVELFALISTHLRFEGAINGPLLSYLLWAIPETNR